MTTVTNGGRVARRRSLSLRRRSGSAADRAATALGDDDLSDGLEGMLERYLGVVSQAMPDFDDREWALVLDALRPPWTPTQVRMIPKEVGAAMDAECLDSRWAIDGKALRARLDHRTTLATRAAICEVVSAVYRHLTEGGNGLGHPRPGEGDAPDGGPSHTTAEGGGA